MTEKLYRGSNETPDILYLTKGQTKPNIKYQCYDSDRELINFTSAYVEFIWKRFYSDTDSIYILETDGYCEYDESGNIEYIFDESDTSEEGTFFGQFKVTYNDGSIEFIPANNGQCIVIT